MKPADFFLGVIHFIGVLVPGAVLLFLQVDPDTWKRAASPIPPWLLFGGTSYLVGQLLLATTEWMNTCAEPLAGVLFSPLRQDVSRSRQEASHRVALMAIGSFEAQFNFAISYLRTRNAEAAAEVDHHMADYKLLRNMLAVILIDLVMPSIAPPDTSIVLLEVSLIVLCGVAFARMFCLTELLAFQYVCIIAEKVTNSRYTPE